MKTSVKTGLNKKNLPEYSGLDLYAALQRIRKDFPDVSPEDIDIRYAESPLPRFTVLSATSCRPQNSTADKRTRRLRIEAASANPIRHLPSNYQENAFLRGFLMVFQHIMNETALKIDKLHAWFRPMECPPEFLPVLAEWLGLCADAAGEEETRRFLRCALSLYRYRGTALGLRAYMGVVCGVTPRLIEGAFPRSGMSGKAGMLISAEDDARIFEAEAADSSFTLHFPVPRETFSAGVLRRLSLIAQREKPAHTSCYISFARPAKKRRKTTAIREDTYMNGEDGFFI
ncbi:MAG: phage tail protein [Spirochaetales bacterium]|jgi:phage tail-like protein|nr:phage tail protein [Spirochaetales bacterium]